MIRSNLPEPVVIELTPAPEAAAVFERCAGLPRLVYFDSSLRDGMRGRYSYLAADPFCWLERTPRDAPLESWRKKGAGWHAMRKEELPPWQGGVAGLLGYELGRTIERLPATQWDEFGLPVLALGWYDWVVAFDHQADRAWIVSQGLPETGDARLRRAAERAAWVHQLICGGLSPDCKVAREITPLARDRLAPCFERPNAEGLWSNFSREGYLAAVERVIEHLRAGDAFQVNLSQRLLTQDQGDPVGSYLRLRKRNPAPFAGYLDGGSWQIASASPERFLHVTDRVVETRPIKGTRPRGATPAEDERLGIELVTSEKERAENVMIVDLLRNDLARVAEDASVEVPLLFSLERYEHVQHLVSAVTARLRPEADLIDLVTAAFPGGSITGAPKVRAQEIITSLEPTARGAYCGTLLWTGYPDERGNEPMDSNILIRTLTHARGWVQAPVGGGVTVRSEPEAEYQETWHKAAGLLDAGRR
ncbi:anthranilate synthase component I family protein [Botrimarina hoheduenensis]|uniref:Aminodeoxychorismate synthase component 1 n=1 Tax=Botrimarina hoheduenensis TaxID=2528000 RepID=A0A5C5WFJ5_9BACT|nr:anthranilate synthase component I family protein [Botrimarina hoheduenensis]TWT48881.1 Aminodeoxychorismate synthase component 1 [Botrimarina hoheduenensis]